MVTASRVNRDAVSTVFPPGQYGDPFLPSLSSLRILSIRRYRDLDVSYGIQNLDELPSSIGLEFQAQLDGSQMYSGHLEAMRLPLPAWQNPLEFYGPSQWKELSKELGSKILPCGDGSCWKAFKPIDSLIEKGKLTFFPYFHRQVQVSPLVLGTP
ncbi:hypothetical protein Tco_1061921 [Tanacetum coccineum]